MSNTALGRNFAKHQDRVKKLDLQESQIIDTDLKKAYENNMYTFRTALSFFSNPGSSQLY